MAKGRSHVDVPWSVTSQKTMILVSLYIRRLTCRLCRSGTVLAVFGLESVVETEDGKPFRCVTRRLLKTLATDQRHVVVVGDRVWFRPQGENDGSIERIAPRHGVLSRMSRGRQHVIVSNIDQIMIFSSAAEPVLKPHLIDRLLLNAEKGFHKTCHLY